jgi:hypothetical protein
MPLQLSHTSIYAIFSVTKSYTTHNTPVCTPLVQLYYSRMAHVNKKFNLTTKKIQSYRSYLESRTQARTTPKIPKEFARSQEPYHGGGTDRNRVLPIFLLIDADEHEAAPGGRCATQLLEAHASGGPPCGMQLLKSADSLTRRGSRSRTGIDAAVGEQCWPVLDETEAFIGDTSCAPAARGQRCRYSVA